jgi:hypothetical protein
MEQKRVLQGSVFFYKLLDRLTGQIKRAHLLQLTTDKKRTEAKNFYESPRFVASHEGMKLHFKQYQYL